MNNELCDTENYALGNLLKRNENKDVELLVWNCIDEVSSAARPPSCIWTAPTEFGLASCEVGEACHPQAHAVERAGPTRCSSQARKA